MVHITAVRLSFQCRRSCHAKTDVFSLFDLFFDSRIKAFYSASPNAVSIQAWNANYFFISQRTNRFWASD
jgi:hypothetical protein